MTTSTCLRCDWQGETTAPLCPNCGTRALYVPAPSSPREPGGAAPDRPRPDPPPPAADTGEGPGRSTRRAVAFALVGLVLALVAGTQLTHRPDQAGSAPFTGAPTRAPTEQASSPPEPSPSPRTAEIARIEPLRYGRHELTAEDVPFSFRTESQGWFKFGRLFVAKSSVRSQEAEAIILWTDIDRGAFAQACGQWWGSPDGSAADFVLHASKAHGTELIEGPTDVLVGGMPAHHVAFTVRRDVGCNPGFFHTWRAVNDGPFWTSTKVGDTIRIWIVEVDGKMLYIEGDTHAGAGSRIARELQGIIDSIRFD